MMRWAALALLLALQLQLSLQQECGNSDVRSKGAAGDGARDDTDAFLRQENDGGAGVIYMSPGIYRIARSITLTKPIIASQDAAFQVDGGVTLTLYNQPEHPYTTFFRGDGFVAFTDGTQFVVPEWFGAKADGKTDDSAAIQKAYNAARGTGNAMLYLRGKYGVGEELFFAPGVVIMSEDKAAFVAVNNNDRGVTFTEGNSGIKNVMPHFVGFKRFCVRLQAVSLAAMHYKTFKGCGDAVRLESTGPGKHCLDNTIWFDKIIACRNGIVFRAENNQCFGGACIFQGNHFVGNLIRNGATSGASYAIFMNTFAYPAWDSNNFDILRIMPQNNPEYRVFQCWPGCDKEVVKIGKLDAMPGGTKIFGNGKMNMMQITLNLAAPLQENQFALFGELNLVEMTGALTPPSYSTPVRCTLSSNSQGSFNGGKALVGTYNTLQAVPTTDWYNGEVRQFFFYHQLANTFLYQIKCNSAKNAQGLPSIDCIQYNDNSGAVPNEVVVWLINQSGGTVAAGSPATFTIAINTLGNAP